MNLPASHSPATMGKPAPAFVFDPLPEWPKDAAPSVYPFVRPNLPGEAPTPDPLRNTSFDADLAHRACTELVSYALRPVAHHASPAGSFVVHDAGLEIEVRGPGELRLDFGVVSAGWLEFECDSLPEGVTLSISEYLRPALVNAGAVNPVKTARPMRVAGSTWRLTLNPEFYEGVRFGWLHAPEVAPWRLRNLRLVCQARPANYLGSFSCDDPILEQIWEVGATTVRLNFLKDYIGAILMERSDRHSWTGDAHVSQAVAMPVFGNFGFVRANLDRTAGDTNGIEGFSLYWILSLLDYVLCSGDREALRHYLPTVRAKLDHAMSVVSKRLPLVFCGHDDRTGGAFEEPDIEENRRFFHYLAWRTVRAVRDVLDWIDGDAKTAECCDRCESLLSVNRPPAIEAGLHEGTEAILAGQPVDAAFLEREYQNPARFVSYSPFNNFFVLQGMTAAGCHTSALALLKRCWGEMLALGATTFWESFRPEWRDFLPACEQIPNGMHGFTSLCHPWSAGPTRWLTDHVLGIRPISPGYADFVFDPISDRPRIVSGSVATPHGVIRAGIDDDVAWVEVPAGCRCHVNGRACPAGRHEGLSLPRSKSSNTAAPEPRYAGRWEPDGTLADAMSGGAEWIAFSAQAPDADLSKIRSATEVIVPDQRPHGRAWRHHYADVQGPFSGALRTCYPSVVQQTFTVDVRRPKSVAYRLGIYCRDLHREGIRQTVEVLGLDSKTLLAPTRLLENFQDGLVLWIGCTGGVRIRICDFPGINASLNGLFFSTQTMPHGHPPNTGRVCQANEPVSSLAVSGPQRRA
ncbi:MAG: hypothetical protein FGM15_01980 [Chthoniobacterales bacterium]|nr:hypothetical protein [Chthoniobacterales bacterium]